MSRSGGQKEKTVVSQLMQCQPQKISQNRCEVQTHESLNWRPIRNKKHPSICVGFSICFVFLSMINNSTQFSAIPGQQEAVIYHQEESPWQSGPVFLLVRLSLSGNLCSLFLCGGEISGVHGPPDSHIISLMCKFKDCPMLTKHHLLICIQFSACSWQAASNKTPIASPFALLYMRLEYVKSPFLCRINFFGKRNWRDDSEIKNTWCSCRGPRFGSKHRHGGSQHL